MKLCELGQKHWESYKKRQYNDIFLSHMREIVTLRKMTLVCVAFNKGNIFKLAFKALKFWCSEAIESERNGVAMGKRLQQVRADYLRGAVLSHEGLTIICERTFWSVCLMRGHFTCSI